HVVEGQEKVDVFAPVDDRQRKMRASYLQDKTSHRREGRATVGRVIAYYADKDLAVLQLERNLQGLRPIKLANDLPKKGDGLHIVGNPGDRPLFSYAYGGTRYVGPCKRTYTDGIYFDGEVVSYSTHCWPGNSGGPVTNLAGQLVGLHSRGTPAEGTAIAVT